MMDNSFLQPQEIPYFQSQQLWSRKREGGEWDGEGLGVGMGRAITL